MAKTNISEFMIENPVCVNPAMNVYEAAHEILTNQVSGVTVIDENGKLVGIRADEEPFEKETLIYIDPEECIDCGACVPECPVEAIFPEEEVPEHWQHYTDINAQWFLQTDGSN